MNFEGALTAMKQGKSVRRSADRWGRRRYYLDSGGNFVEHGDTPKKIDTVIDPDATFSREELLAEDWEEAETQIETIVIRAGEAVDVEDQTQAE